MSKLGLLYLLIAIGCEVTATLSLKASDGFRHLLPSLIVVVGYGAAFFALSLTLREISVGVAYALWSAIGTILITILSAVFFKQHLNIATVLGMMVTIVGVVIINLGSPETN